MTDPPQFTGQVEDDPLRHFMRAKRRLQAATDACALDLAAALPGLVGGPRGFLKVLVQWMASRVRRNDVPPALLAWIDQHVRPVGATSSAAPSAATKVPEQVLAHALSYADHASVLAASHTCATWALAARLPTARSDLALVWGKGLDSLEAHIAERCGHGVPYFVPFLRARRLRVGRRVRARGAAPLPPVARARALLAQLGCLSVVHVESSAAWGALAPQAALCKVFVNLEDAPVTATDMCRVAANPECVTEVAGHLALTSASAPVWSRLSHLESLRVERAHEMRLGTSAPYARVWPRLTRLAIKLAGVSGAPLSQTVASFIGAVVRGRDPFSVTLAFVDEVPHPPVYLEGDVLRLAALHADRASASLLWWLRRVRPTRVVVNSWAVGARVSPADIIRTLAERAGAERRWCCTVWGRCFTDNRL